MVRCFGVSSHTYKTPNKPISEGYKTFTLAEHGYIYSFLWSSRVKGVQRHSVLRPRLTPPGSLVQILAPTLPRHGITIYLDNYFTSVPLLMTITIIWEAWILQINYDSHMSSIGHPSQLVSSFLLAC